MADRLKALCLLALTALYIYNSQSAIHRLSAAYDEPFHLAAGFAALEHNNYKITGLWHPPLAQVTAASPLYLAAPPNRPTLAPYQQELPFTYGDMFVFQNQLPAQHLLHQARNANWAIFTLIILLALWATRSIVGINAMFWTTVLFLFEPNLLAHGTLVSTDYAAAALTLGAWACAAVYLKRPSSRFAALSGLALAALLLSRLSAVLSAFPIIGMLVFGMRRSKHVASIFLHIVVAICGVGLVALLTYQGQSPLTYLYGLLYTIEHASIQRPSFLLGDYSTDGWPWYYLVTTVLKTNPFHLIVFALGIIWCRSIVSENTDSKFPVCTLYIVPAIYLLATASATLQPGHRYILPIYPLLLVIGGVVVDRIEQQHPRWRAALFGGLLLGVVSTQRVSPWFLSYVHEFAGGSSRGYHYLTDSNVDWGQGLQELKLAIQEDSISSIYLSYFGAGDPEAYGIEYIPVGFVTDTPRFGTQGRHPVDEEKIYFAISVTNYQHTYHDDKQLFEWLRPIAPVKLVADSILLYDLTDHRDALQQLEQLLRRSDNLIAADQLNEFLRRREG